MRHTRMGKLTRRALSLLFALTLLWECGALTPKARAADVVAADGTVNLVLWQNIAVSNVQGNLEKYCSGELQPILMSYRDGGEEYFMCATKDNWRWQSKDYNLVGMPKVSDHRFDEIRDEWKTACKYSDSSFITIGTFNSLWGRYQKEGGYSGMVLAVSDGNDGPGEYLGPGKPYAGQTYGGHKVRDTCFVVRPEETKPFRVTFDDYEFRMWNYDKDGDNEDVVFDGGTVKLSDDDREHIRNVLVGTVINASALTHDFTVQRDQATTMGRPVSYIPEGVTLRVASGGVLTVDGILINDGKIVVEQGGLLVLREESLLLPLPVHCNKTACGGISSAGTIVVEQNAKLIGGGANGIYLTGGVVYNFGTIASENFTATKKQLINNQSKAWVVAGRSYGPWYENYLLKFAFKYALTGDTGYRSSMRELTGKYCGSCPLPYGRVNIADGAVYGDQKYYRNYGSFGDVDVVKVFYHDGSSAYEVLQAPGRELGYQRSDTSHTVTQREVVYASGQIDTLRSQYDQIQNMKQNLPGKTNREVSLTVDTGLTFEQYVEQYFRSQGINLDEKVTVWDGVITVNGLSALTIPWNQPFSVVDQSGDYLVKRMTPVALGNNFTLGG